MSMRNQRNIMWGTQSSFEFKKGGDIQPMTKTYDLEKQMKRPEHKTLRLKFNPEKKDCL
jgi:hypothetical protein